MNSANRPEIDHASYRIDRFDDADYAQWSTPTVLNTHHVATLAATWGPESWSSY